MAGNKTPTTKSLALGAAMREARIAAGHENLTRFAEMIGKTAATVSRWETGQRTPRPEDVAQYLTVLGIGGEQFEDVVALARDPDVKAWFAVSMPEQRRHMDALLRFERDAQKIVAVGPSIVPGWLQTEAYVRAIMTAGDGVPDDEIEERVRIRLGRREMLRNTEREAFVGQAALLQQIGGADVLLGQLEFLLHAADEVTLRVAAFTADWHPGLEGPWTMLHSTDSTVVYRELRRSGLFLHEEADIQAHLDAIAAVREVAMSPQESKGLIAETINQLKK